MIALALALLVQENFASAVILPDVDGDGHADLVVLDADGYLSSRLWLVSGAELKVLVEFKTGSDDKSPTIYGIYGSEHDFNEDGIPDVLSYWYVPGEAEVHFETRVLDAKDPRRVLKIWQGTPETFGPDLDGDGLPDPTFVERVGEETSKVFQRGSRRFKVSQRGSHRGLLWEWAFEAMDTPHQLDWIPDASGDGVMDLVVLLESAKQGIVAHLLDGATGDLLVQSQLLTDSYLWVTIAPCHTDWNADGAGDFFVGVIDPTSGHRSRKRHENRVLLVSGADLSIHRTWEHCQVFPGNEQWIDYGLGYCVTTILDQSGRETCLTGEFEYKGGRGCVVALTNDSASIIESEQPDSRSFGGYINPGADWNGDGSDDYIVGCAKYTNWVPDHGFLEIRDGRTHSLLLTLRLADLDPKASSESGEDDD